MTLPELETTLANRGVRLVRLVVDAPRGVLTPEIKAALATHKSALLRQLSGSSPAAPPVDDHPPEVDGEVHHGLDLSTFQPPRRTPWGTLVYSAPDAPPIEAFGPPPGLAAPTEPGPLGTARGPRDVRRGDQWLPWHCS
jgi:hypothetical protein